MVDTKHRTTVEIAVDDRQLRKLAEAIERVFSGGAIDAFEKSVERSSAAIEGMVKAVERLQQNLDKMEKAQQRQDQQERQKQSQPQRRAPTFGAMAAASFAGNYAAGAAQRFGGAAQAIPAGQATTAFLGAIPIAGGFLSGAAQAALGFYQSFAGQQQALLGAYGAGGAGGADFRGLAAAHGVGPSASPAMRAQFAGLTGRRGAGLNNDLAGQLLGYQQYMGLGSLGAVLGAQEISGEVADPGVFLEKVVSAGLAAGIREARLDRFLQQVATFVEQAQSQGIPIQAEELTKTITGLSELGLAPEAAAQIGQSMATSLRELSMGGSGAGRALALTVGGGMGSGTSYLDARRTLEENPGLAIQRIVGRFRGNPHMIGMVLRSMGINLSVDAQTKLASGDMSGFDMEAIGLGAGRLMDNQENAEGRGTAATEAGFEMERGALGSQYAGVARSIRNLDIKLAKHAAKVTAELLDTIVERMNEALEAFKEGGIMGLLGNIAGQLKEAFRGMVTALMTAMGNMLIKLGETMNSQPLIEMGRNLVATATEDSENAAAGRRRAAAGAERDRATREGMEGVPPGFGNVTVGADGTVQATRAYPNGRVEVYDSRLGIRSFDVGESLRGAAEQLTQAADALDATAPSDAAGPE